LRMQPTGATSYEHSEMNVSSKVKHDISSTLPGMQGGAMYGRLYPVERSSSRVSEGLKLHHGDAVNERSSKLNVIYKGKLMDLLVTL
jgi:hypothetical protein